MNAYPGQIDTDMAIATILSNFNSDYIHDIVEYSMKMKFRPFSEPMPNIVDVITRQLKSVLVNSPDYQDNVNNVIDETYKEIITYICDSYNLTFTGDLDSMPQDNLYSICRTLYNIFVSRFTDFYIDFLVNYIINNVDSIHAYLLNDPESIKPKDQDALYNASNYSNPNFILVHANINKVIYNMASYDITLYNLIDSFLDPSSASVIKSLLMDNGDIYKNYYAIYTRTLNTAAGVITTVKLKLQERTCIIKDL